MQEGMNNEMRESNPSQKQPPHTVEKDETPITFRSVDDILEYYQQKG